MDPNELATCCKALGDPTRVRILRFLLDCHGQVALDDQGDARPVCGPTVGAVCCHVTGIDKVTSTISFHLKELRAAGLIRMEKRGKFMLCSPNRETLTSLAEFFVLAAGSGCCEPTTAPEPAQQGTPHGT